MGIEGAGRVGNKEQGSPEYWNIWSEKRATESSFGHVSENKKPRHWRGFVFGPIR